MNCVVRCEDFIEVKTGDKKHKEISKFRISVDNDYEEELVVKFSDWSMMGSAEVPVRYWAQVKDIVDRLVIKAEHLLKEDC